METQEITEKLNKIIKNETSIFQRPIIPGECPTFDEETANCIRGTPGIIPKIVGITKT